MKRATIVLLFALTACGSTSLASSETPAASSPSLAAASPTPTPSPSPIPTPSPSPSPSPVASPSPPASGYIGLASCPAYASGQHPLGSPAGPGVGVHADPTLNWVGCGSVTVPPGTSRFLTGNNWQLGFAVSCPEDLNLGFGSSVTFNEVLIGGATGPDSEGGAGPWTDSGGGIMAHGGNYQIRVTSPDLRCRWHVAAYPS